MLDAGASVNSTIPEKEQWWVDFEDMMLDRKKKSTGSERWKGCARASRPCGSMTEVGERSVLLVDWTTLIVDIA